jgi:hypothetical protein
VSSRQNSYSIVDTSTATLKSRGTIVSRVSGLDAAISLAKSLGGAHRIAHCSSLLSSDENNATADASVDFYTLVTHDMSGRPIFEEQ